MRPSRKRLNRKSGKNRAANRPTNSLPYQQLEAKELLAGVGWDGPGQGSAELTYYVGKAPQGITQAQFQTTIDQALKVWADSINVKFTQTQQTGLANSLDFTSRPIDGTGGVLARAYFPKDVNRGSIAGDVQFDSTDNWEIGNAKGNQAFDLLYVAVHEIGHALGIDHIQGGTAVLSPTVNGNQTFQGLSTADIDAAMELYTPAKNSTNPTPPNEEPNNPDSKDPNNETPDKGAEDPPAPEERPTPEEPRNGQPDSETPDTNPGDEKPDVPSDGEPDSRPPENEFDPFSPDDDDPTSPDDGQVDDPFMDQEHQRFERFLNYLFRNFRMFIWSPFSFFPRW